MDELREAIIIQVARSRECAVVVMNSIKQWISMHLSFNVVLYASATNEIQNGTHGSLADEFVGHLSCALEEWGISIGTFLGT